MKADNPMLTAFALGELSLAEQAEIQQELQTDREIAAEVAETKEIARILRDGLAGEPFGELADHQRDAIFRELALVEKERSLSAGGPSTTEAFAPLIVPRSGWWNRTGPWQAIAACSVAGFAAYALLMNVGNYRRSASSQAGDIVVQVPMDGNAQTAGTTGPDLISPPTPAAPTEVVASGFNGIKPRPNVPKVTVPPNVQVDAKPPLMAEKAAKEEPLEPVAKAPDPAESPAEPRRGPYVVGSSKNPELVNMLARASIARPENKIDPLTDENVALYLKDKGLRAGSTYEEFLRVFKPVPNKPGRYQIIDAPSVQMDVEFTTSEGQPLTSPPAAESRVKKISKTYLE
jgi:anti-sigma factor RsiW